jgi:hypothetical protein
VWLATGQDAGGGKDAMGTARARRVPVEHRFFGLDKRTIPFAAVAVAVWLVWAVVLPQIDERVPWDDTIRAGQRLQVTDTVTFAPAEGWGLLSGLRTTDVTASGIRATPQTSITNDGVTFYVSPGAWDGTPRALLDQITKITTTESGSGGLEISTRPTTFQTASGLDGVLEGFKSPRVEGLIGAFVADGQGIQVQVVGPVGQLNEHADEIGRMLSSFREEESTR